MSHTNPHPPTGFVAPGFEKVLTVLSDTFARGADKACSFAAYYRGQPVVNLWSGYADVGCERPWKEETMGFFYSTTKFVASITVSHMIDRGLLRYDEKIAYYWPEFAVNGKENITLEMLLSHRAGIAVLSENYKLRWVIDNPRLLHDRLVKQKPFWPPGEAYGYHPFTVGLYLNEIVKRVDRKGRSLSEYFLDEIAGPFGIDFYIGLPKPLQYRAVRLESVHVSEEVFDKQRQAPAANQTLLKIHQSQPKDWHLKVAHMTENLQDSRSLASSPASVNPQSPSNVPCPSSPRSTSAYFARYQKLSSDGTKRLQVISSSQLEQTSPQASDCSSEDPHLNNPDFMEIPLSSTHGAGTALAMAKLSGILANGGKHEGKTLLTPEAIAKLQDPLSYGNDLTTSLNLIFGRGTCIFPVMEGSKIWYMFGHYGLGDQCSAADPHYKVGWAYTTNYLDTTVLYSGKYKWQPLIAALFECVHKVENVQVERRMLSSYEELEQVKRGQKQNSLCD